MKAKSTKTDHFKAPVLKYHKDQFIPEIKTTFDQA